jgi:IS5 family transposase
MGPRPHTQHTDELSRPRLDEQLKMRHPLVKLSTLRNWDEIGHFLDTHFISSRGRQALTRRLVAGLPLSAVCQRRFG